MTVAIGIAALLALQWAAPTLLAWDRGIYGGDSLWYHLPFAAHIAQSGSVTELLFTDPLYLNWFYPQNSELVHAGGMLLFGNDFLSPALNLGWLGLALLAGWCIGRPYGAGASTLAAVAALLSADLLVSRQPGNANNDIVAIALLLASAAILINAPKKIRTRRPLPWGRGLCWSPALAAGLALGTKLTVVVPVAALSVGVVAIAASADAAARRPCSGAAGCWRAAGTGTCATWWSPESASRGSPRPPPQGRGPRGPRPLFDRPLPR